MSRHERSGEPHHRNVAKAMSTMAQHRFRSGDVLAALQKNVAVLILRTIRKSELWFSNPLKPPNRAEGAMCMFCVSRDGTYAATGFDSGAIRIWNLRSGQITFQARYLSGPVWSAAFSPIEVDRIAFVQDVRVVIVDLRNRTAKICVHKGDGPPRLVPWAVAFFPDGKTLATAPTYGSVNVWNVFTGDLIQILPTDPTYFIAKLEFCDIEGRLHLVCGHYFGVAMLDVEPTPSQSSHQLGWKEGIEDHSIVTVLHELDSLSLSQQEVRSTVPSAKLKEIRHNDKLVSCYSLSPDHRRVLSGSNKDTVGRICNVSDGKEVATLESSSPITAVAWSPDGNTVATGSEDGLLVIWDSTRAEVIHRVEGLSYGPKAVSAVAWSRDGKVLVWGREADGVVANISFFHLKSGQMAAEVDTYGGSIRAIHCAGTWNDDFASGESDTENQLGYLNKEEIWSVDEDGVVCRWSIENIMKQLCARSDYESPSRSRHCT
ncbi:quinon protein alcohol dehydrogenase-like superfamily [Cristinia sonorae]|uniref:Quinon protein alcohol dehydrogenase-like superfamily n=1 Tax=Cristinia sonorae TaxID=1940300 RepID=A0A8K0XQG5_9AGAR|nr:quinon protein alcohol dehydrogenase-like superfamily [Cristinia sonorae]